MKAFVPCTQIYPLRFCLSYYGLNSRVENKINDLCRFFDIGKNAHITSENIKR